MTKEELDLQNAKVPEVTPDVASTPVDATTVPDAPADVTATPVVDEPAAPSARDKFNSRIKGSFPDDNLEGDDAIYDKASSHLDDLEGFKTKGVATNQKLLDLFQSEPELEGIIKGVLKGVPVRAAIAEYFSPEDLAPQDGEPDFAAYTDNTKTRTQKLADKKKFEQEVTENLTASESAVKEFATENNLDDAQTVELLDVVSGLMNDLYRGVLPKDLLNHVLRSKTKDADINDAASLAELKGRNTKIEAVKTNDKKADVLPSLNGAGGEAIETEQPIKSKSMEMMDRLTAREKQKNRY